MIAKKYRKLPVTIEAMKWNGKNHQQIMEWANGRLFKYWIDHVSGHGTCFLEIDTLEGTMIASIGDYIIRGIDGEYYPCKPDIFVRTYEEIND